MARFDKVCPITTLSRPSTRIKTGSRSCIRFRNVFPIAIALVALSQKQAAGVVLFDVPSVFRTIQSAVDAVPDNSVDRYKIQLAAGVYNETVNIPAEKGNITLMGMPSVANSAVVIQPAAG